MKKFIFVLTMCILAAFIHAQAIRTIEVHNPGTLISVLEPDLKSITDLTITGHLNAIDFRIIRDSMPALKNLDLTSVVILQYSGTEGTNVNTANPTFPLHYQENQIPSSAFLNKTNFETLLLPDSAKTIGSKAFYKFSSVNPIQIPRNITQIGSGFVYCRSAITVHPENETYSALDGVLYNKLKTQLVQVPTSKAGSFTIPSTVTTINGNSMYGCVALTDIIIPKSVTSIQGNTISNCSAQIHVDENNTVFSSLDGVLLNKAQTTLIQIPISRTGSYKIPQTVTSIGISSFAQCTGLTSVTFPQNISAIGNGAFSGCTNLSVVRIFALIPPVINDGVFQNVSMENCVLQVPGGVVDAYKAVAGWKNFKNIVEPLSTNAAASVTFTTAVLQGKILSLDTTVVTSYGFCWNTTGTPTISDNKIEMDTISDSGIFNYTLSNLAEGTTYYIRSYMTENAVTYYGNQVLFKTQSIPDAAGEISGVSTVCQGQSNVTYSIPPVINATSYVWTLPDGAVGSGSTNSITINYEKNAVSGMITVKGQNEYHAGLSSSLSINVNPLPANPGIINGNSSVCIDDSLVVYSISPIENASSYNWTLPIGATGKSMSNSISVKYTKDAVSGNITVKGINDCGEGMMASMPVTVNKLPSFTLSDKTVYCGESVTLANAIDFVDNKNLRYKWMPATGLNNDTIPNPVATVTNDIIYTVSVTNQTGCRSTGEVKIIIKPMEKPQIGIVGVSNTNKNVVAWNKPISSGIDSYVVYRETTVSDVYEKIGTVPYSALSVFTDELSNPTVKSGKYKISIVDKSGLETQLSEPHKTMHLTINKGQGNTWNLIWEPYTGFTPSTYNIYRGSSATSLGFLDATSGSSTQFSDIAAPSGDVYYQVEVISPVLVKPSQVNSGSQKIIVSEKATAISYNSSRSNIASHISSGINELNDDSKQIIVYPNPAVSQFKIDFAGGSVFEIVNLTGQIIYKGNLLHDNIVQTDNFKPGVYLIKFDTGKSIGFKKVIIKNGVE